MKATPHAAGEQTFAQQLEQLWEHLSHILPAQAPIQDFVHHNTLHGFQHLPFPEALKAAHNITGAYGYLPANTYRNYFQRGRIDSSDVTQVLEDTTDLCSGQQIATLEQQALYQLDIYRTALIYPIEALTERQLIWQLEARQALKTFQYDLPTAQREQLLAHRIEQNYADLTAFLSDLWAACAEALALNQHPSHPETLLAQIPHFSTTLDLQIRLHAQQTLQGLVNAVGSDKTLRQLLLELLGVDIFNDIRPALLRYLSHWLDQGVATWPPQQTEQGFYRVWKHYAQYDLAGLVDDIPDWREHLESLPDDATETIETELRRLAIPQAHWLDYLEHLALELPGWSGMVLWRHQRPHYGDLPRTIHMQDYLAVRLVLEHIFARRLCRQQWLQEANLSAIRSHAQSHALELWVGYYTHQGLLPEYLQNIAQQQMSRQQHNERIWHTLAYYIWHFQQHTSTNRPNHYSLHEHGWRLFRLAQHLALTPRAIRSFSTEQIKTIFACLNRLDDETSGYLWLQAYERHYREWIFSALSHNHNAQHPVATRKVAQLIFCMDDREEGFRRHLEEVNPRIETLGAAAFFNIPMNWQALDQHKSVKLCPVPVTPVHVVKEQPAPAMNPLQLQSHTQRLKHFRYWQDYLYQAPRSRLFTGTSTALISAPLAMGVLLGKAFSPRLYGQWIKQLTQRFLQPVTTELHLTTEQPFIERSAESNQTGFTLTEQAQLVGDFLRAHGLIQHFAPLVVLLGHYSSNQNNPHQAAYGCGACSGRYSGPNARVFAAMANNHSVRQLLRTQSIDIPDDCWFLGAEHDTCNEHIQWFDTHQIPTSFSTAWQTLKQDLSQTQQRSAHERCRKLMSAPPHPSLLQALQHVIGRSMDYSQPRPELGHVTNATALIGRRSMSQGIFFDRRAFLISYDYQNDPQGLLLERILLSVGPVGAGINLEYYFSMVSNQRYGAGTKVTHNLVGLFGVMEGASSDLRTGLPKQMIEIHEAMRLLIVLECDTERVQTIYQRQPVLQELIGHQWVQLAVKNPITGQIYYFIPARGFIEWTQPIQAIATVARSAEWYSGHHDHLPPSLVRPTQAISSC